MSRMKVAAAFAACGQIANVYAHTRPLRTLTQYPEGHLLNPATRYVPAVRTDVAATWARARARMAAAAQPLPKPTQGALFDEGSPA